MSCSLKTRLAWAGERVFDYNSSLCFPWNSFVTQDKLFSFSGLVFPSAKHMGLYLDQWFSNIKCYTEVYIIKISLKFLKCIWVAVGMVSLLPKPSEGSLCGGSSQVLRLRLSKPHGLTVSHLPSDLWELQFAVLSVLYHLLPHRTRERIEGFESHSEK